MLYYNYTYIYMLYHDYISIYVCAPCMILYGISLGRVYGDQGTRLAPGAAAHRPTTLEAAASGGGYPGWRGAKVLPRFGEVVLIMLFPGKK